MSDDRRVAENLSLAEFQEQFRFDLPQSASSINVYSYSTIDSWDLRILFETKSDDVSDVKAWICAETNYKPGPKSDNPAQILDSLTQTDGMLKFADWPIGNDAPSWWQAVDFSKSEVLAVDYSEDSFCLWLYDHVLRRVAVWKYVLLSPNR